MALVYDASRIATRILNPTPNGIDRLDATLLGGLVDPAADHALVFGWGGPRLLPASYGLAALERAEAMWHEGEAPGGSALDALADWLHGGHGPGRIVEPRRGRLGAAAAALGRFGLRRGAGPVAAAPRRAVYLNATHFPLDWPSHTAWLARRPDVRAVALVHDLLPVDHPGLFWAGEAARHGARLAVLARHGAAAIVTSAAVEARLAAAMRAAGRRDLAVLRAAPPVSPMFHAPRRPLVRLAAVPYFVCCGTIEPRKNHRLLLAVWRALLKRMGRTAPRLVVVGKRGWLCEPILAEMQDPALRGHVVEVASLSTADYRLLLDNACGLLAPSLAEGFGLPLAEALTCGAPAVASDIPPFREQASGAATLLDPEDVTGWTDAVAALARQPRRGEASSSYRPVSEAAYLGAVRAFLTGLG